MDQVKIGKFILKCRKEKGFTQNELAKKIGVTDKAISKWENGRCMMDISLLKSLSEVLDVSVVELINGEKIEEKDISSKSGEAVEKTIKYAKKKMKKSKIKIISVLSILFLIFGFLIYKVALVTFYSFSDEKIKTINELAEGLTIKDNISIYKRVDDNFDYIEKDDIRIKNIFQDFKVDENVSKNGITRLVEVYSDGRSSSITFGKFTYESLIKAFTNDEITFYGGKDPDPIRNFNGIDRKDFLLQKDINNDLDFIKYISENCYIKSNIFDSRKELEEKYAVNLFTSVVMPLYDEIYLIDGDYTGYMGKIQGITEVTIIKSNIDYKITFMGKFFTDEIIMDILNTMEIK